MKLENIKSRKKFIVFVSSVLIIIPFFYKLLSDPGASGLEVPSFPFQTIWSERKILLLGMGDSILTGYGAGGKEYSFFELITNNPPGDQKEMIGKNLKKVFPNIIKDNIAENSTSSGDHIYQIDSVSDQSGDVFGIVILSTGGIDLIHDYGNSPPEDEAIYGANKNQIDEYAELFEKRLDILFPKIKSRFPGGVKIFVFLIYDPTDGVGDIENVNPFLKLFKNLPAWPDGLYALNKWNTILQKKAKELDYVETIDVHKYFLGHGIHHNDKSNQYYKKENLAYWYYYNLEDPNKEGYDAIRKLVLNKMIENFYKKKF